MEMEFTADFNFSDCKIQDRAKNIIKRKRSKRTNHQKPCSPLRVSSISTSTSDGDCLIDSTTIAESPVVSLDTTGDTTTKEDEDMANCLILLAQSHALITEDGFHKSDQIRQKTDRLASKRLTEMNGYTFYECKTCNRTFPSFQALGGHRASHKKPKVSVSVSVSGSVLVNDVEEKKTDSVMRPSITEYAEEDEVNRKAVTEDDEQNKVCIVVNDYTGVHNHINKAKVHECSICGSEFLSGQALGGHMRKHRPVPVSGNRPVISTTTGESAYNQIAETSLHGNNTDLLSLDLNFPPPEAVEDVRSKYQFTGGSQQPRMVFSAPAFVDCHY
ncbi:putative transcription factor C2H2 family [Helianthus annuus]|uniref:Putative zinc finger, C2H2-like protein n=1 Tax=Helianthus annuus TaxID=4232 RepID=A0A251VJJ9_HELAN|nr:zinc finger protein ZAT5 [Helianthus annuus]KAF5819794.1 putative transcription factor C2H2 family [Helianthus annuus]KAJ0605912.1 putative transcription factor C2H2 family [Helianthus annuus]KAJ0616802.1 putative transcription factor C2H2 family [Helianthus annuus]KAJ0619907.1 putative transcription factor C2H2 family [Helianthus annuus]KAJ0787339.1 putative transcription factor C2H2 family [Helianthus annuus]